MELKTGRVYKIIHNQSDICYVGSTFNTLRDRFRRHKDQATAISPYFKEFGFENFKIILIKEYEVIDKKHLYVYEQLWMSKLKNINEKAAITFDFISKIHHKQYLEKNKEHIAQTTHAYYIANADAIKARNRANAPAYREKNAESIKEKKRIYYERTQSLRITTRRCVCGKDYTLHHKKRHEQSKYHINNS